MKKILATLALCLALAGCSSVSSGVITDKHYKEGYYYTTTMCSVWDANGACVVYVPIQHYSPPSWRFDLRQYEETGWVYVSEGTYNSYEIGDLYEQRD